MQRFSHDQILDEIHTLFDWNPPLLSPASPACPEVTTPSCFYYDHLDARLSLKKIIPMPALVPYLSTTVDRVLNDIKEREIILPPVMVGNVFPSAEYCKRKTYNEPITNAYSVGKAYQSTTAYHCGVIASMLLLSPKSPTWEAFFEWSEIAPGTRDNPGLDENFVFHMNHHVGDYGVDDAVWNSIEGDSLLTLRRIVQKSPILAHWEIFAITPNNEELLKTIGELPMHTIHHEMEDIPPAIDLSHRPDAMTLSWGTPMSSLAGELPVPAVLDLLNAEASKDPPRRSSRSQKGRIIKNATSRSVARTTEKKDRHEEHSRTITLPNRTEPREEPLSGAMLKHAWLRAVRMDSSFVVFHSGNLERIAFRHRGSQTLYVSDLIDVPHCKDPGYGKLHIGLYMSIMHDVMDRTRQQPEKDDATQGKKRRRKENASGPDPKRSRTRALAAKIQADEIEHEKTCDYLISDATRRDLLLLKMCYGVYNSPSPSYFLRSGRPWRTPVVFEPHQYFSVTLTSDIAEGATGVVHGATLKFASDGGQVRNMSVVVKFATKPQQQKKLRHEHSIYEHLASSRVKGVPRVFGLFEDHNSDIIALVMTHTGTALVTLYRGKDEIVVEEPQRSAFLRVMADIHTAGVRHRDIRPENLTVDDAGRVFIIDFDMAEISPTEGAKSRELLHMTELLDGNYYPPHEFPSERTNPQDSGSGSESGSGTSSSHSSSHSSTEEE